MQKQPADFQTTTEFTSAGIPSLLGIESDPLEVTRNGDGTISLVMEGVVPDTDYNVDAELECRLSQADAIALRDWLIEVLKNV